MVRNKVVLFIRRACHILQAILKDFAYQNDSLLSLWNFQPSFDGCYLLLVFV